LLNMCPAASLAIDPIFASEVAASFPCQGMPHDLVELATRFVARSVVHPEKPKSKGIGMDTASKPRTTYKHRNERVTKADTAERVAFALQAWGKERSYPIARIQHIAGVDRATAAAWWHGRNPPLFHNLINLAAQIPELKAECRRMFAMEQDHHPDFQRDLAALLQRYGR
jgi:hypothetical protein